MSMDLTLTYNGTNEFDNLHIAGNTVSAHPNTISVYIDGTTFANDVTAFVTAAEVQGALFNSDIVSVLPKTIYSNGGGVSATLDFTLTASTGECLSGNADNTLSLTMSTYWLSGNQFDGSSSTATASSVEWANTTQTLTQTICTNNVPYTNLLAPNNDLQLCALEQSRKRLLGYL